jgi:RNA polymerase sigma factor (sigma-70 family)
MAGKGDTPLQATPLATPATNANRKGQGTPSATPSTAVSSGTPSGSGSKGARLTSGTGLAEMKSGGHAACETFVREEYEGLYRWFLWMSRCPERAADLTQDTFAGFWQSLSRKVPDVTPRAWLYAIGRNLWRKQCRSRRVRSKEEEGQALLEQISGSDPTPASIAEDREWVAALHAEVAQLPEDFREVLCLRLWQDFEYEEIAAVQGISRDLARWRYFRARQLLQGKLKAWQLEEEKHGS